MIENIRYGIVGMGGFGAHRRMTLRNAGCFEIVGGVDVRTDAFEKAENEEGRTLRRYADVDALAADPAIDAVFISTPAHLHVPLAMKAACAGKAVFVEKPLGPDLEECRKLVEYCEQHNIPHGHGFSLRHAPVWVYVKQLLDDGALGRLVSVSAACMHSGGLAFSADNWRFAPDHNPGGPLFQCGIHKIDLLRFLLGDGHWTSGLVRKHFTSSPTDDAYVLTGLFGGVPCTFHSHYVASYRHALEIYGAHGGLWISEYPLRVELKTTQFEPFKEEVRDITSEMPPSDKELDALRDFAIAVRERRQPITSGREGYKAMKLVLEAVRVAVPID
ncbi:MAG: Gfo/Idh/MocA family oxidoreductase [Phycisphaeraceae bacterium]|nr:Gfo/Idh/MocA family oxidoreductase [Phycisphaeraceae bacterium]